MYQTREIASANQLHGTFMVIARMSCCIYKWHAATAFFFGGTLATTIIGWR